MYLHGSSPPSPSLLKDLPPLLDPVITADGEASVWIAPNITRLTFLLTASGERAVVANEALQQLETSVRQAMSKAGENAKLRFQQRGTTLSGAGRSGSSVTAAGEIQMRRYLGVELRTEKVIAPLVDAALEAGASELVEMVSAVRGAEKARQTAISRATERAKAKAEASAQAV